MTLELFKYLKESKWDKFKNYIDENVDEDYNIYDNNYNYLLHYIINYNKYDLLNFFLEKIETIKLDILDTDERTILYVPIKYNYMNIIKLLLKISEKIIGIPIIDLRDKNGYTALHYTIIFKNLELFKILIESKSNPYIKDNLSNDSFLLSIQYNNYEMVKYLLENNYNINTSNKFNENGLHLSINFKFNKLSNYLIDNDIDINQVELKNGITPFHQAIILNLNKLAKKMLNKDANINLQDYFGNSSVHYCIIENNFEMLEYIFDLKQDIQYNNTNINGDTILHLFIDNYNLSKEKNIKILNHLIENTNINIQDNQGNTALHLLTHKNILSNKLINKNINLFIKNEQGETVFDLSEDKEKLIKIAAESYYKQLKQNKKWKLNWEIFCSTNNLKEIQKLMNKKTGDIKSLCLDKIINLITQEKKSMPSLEYEKSISFDTGIAVKFCSYTGSTIDIICGLLFLKKTYQNIGFVIDSPLTQHDKLEKYYKKLGIDIKYKLEFINFEFVWIYQQLYVPTYFDVYIQKILESDIEYIIIPIGIELDIGAHANIILWDIKNHKIERFEPNGKYNPPSLNYNPDKLDLILINKLSCYDDKLEIIKPKDYLPLIGFQTLESLETPYCKSIGDPNGFCGVWSIWWIYYRLQYKSISPKKLADKLIKQIKMENYSFKKIIRNFSANITKIRDEYLENVDLNINQWINGTYTDKKLNELEKIIIQDF